MTEKQIVKEIQINLLNWYRKYYRELPWRQDKDPYKIWVSEIMLQQTRVETVIPYFKNFIRQFPTIQSLAIADEEKVLKAWEGLGYYSRARHLHAAAKEVMENYHGEVPNDPEKLSRLKGIGPYTQGAILSIAFDMKWPAVDGNVFRVLARLFALTDDIAQSSSRKKFEEIARSLIPEESPGDFNQALMELGATICKPTSPTCLLCPIREDCQAFHQGKQEEFPVKRKARPARKIPVVFLWITDNKSILLEKRKEHGLLAGMWALPTIEKVDKSNIDEKISKYLHEKSINYTKWRYIGQFDHIFTHRHWIIHLYSVNTESVNVQDPYCWVSFQKLSTFPMANVYRKAFQKMKVF